MGRSSPPVIQLRWPSARRCGRGEERGQPTGSAGVGRRPVAGRTNCGSNTCAGPGGKVRCWPGSPPAEVPTCWPRRLRRTGPDWSPTRSATTRATRGSSPTDSAAPPWPGCELRPGAGRRALFRPRRAARRRRRGGGGCPATSVGSSRVQQQLLVAALDAGASGGVVGYVTCSPHLTETVGVVHAAAPRRTPVVSRPTSWDATARWPGVPDLGDGPYVQALAPPARYRCHVLGPPTSSVHSNTAYRRVTGAQLHTRSVRPRGMFAAAQRQLAPDEPAG